jgi:two-component system chemotaxis response regulator CheB
VEDRLPAHDLIVLGASAGGVEAISKLVAGLPPDLPAAVCIVVHLRPYADSSLAHVLERASSLPVVAARQKLPLRPGTIYVAVPDLHLLVAPGDGDEPSLRLVRGPRENRSRPAINPLFRSAALAFGPRVIGVLLSGALDDGIGGLWTVKDRGGITVVQDPDDAAVPHMPASALAEVEVDHVATAAMLGPLLGRLVREPIARQASEGPLRFRCEVGHAHSAASLAESQNEVIEAAMWAALRALEDKMALSRRRAAIARSRRLPRFADQFAVEERTAQQHATALRSLLRRGGNTAIRPEPGSHEGPQRPERAPENAL